MLGQRDRELEETSLSLSCGEGDQRCRRRSLARRCDPCSGLNHARWRQGLQSQPGHIAVQPPLDPLCFLRCPSDLVTGQLMPLQMILQHALEETSTPQSHQPALASSSCTLKTQSPAHPSHSTCSRRSPPSSSLNYAARHVYSPPSPSSPTAPSSMPYSIYHL